MRRLLGILAVTVVLATTGTAHADTSYLLFPAYGVGSYRSDYVRENFTNLLQGAMTGKGITVTVSKESCKDADCAMGEANGEYSFVVIPQLTQVGHYYKCIATVIDTKTSEVVFKTDAAKATEDELDVLAKRVGESIMDRKSFAGTLTRGEGVAQEIEEPKLRSLQFLYGVGVGVAYPFKGIDKSETQVSFDGMFGANLDRWQAMFYMPVRFNATGTGKNTEIGFDFLTKYHFTNGFVAPFAAAGVGAHLLKQTSFNTKVGFAAMGGGGIALFRTSKIEIPIMILYQYLVMPGAKDPQSVVGTIGIYY